MSGERNVELSCQVGSDHVTVKGGAERGDYCSDYMRPFVSLSFGGYDRDNDWVSNSLQGSVDEFRRLHKLLGMAIQFAEEEE